MQIPLLPLLLVRAPRMIAVEFSAMTGVGGFVLTAATLWFTFRQTY